MLKTDLDLPEHLAERIRLHPNSPSSDGPVRGVGEFVLYWMRTAVRAHENPALDVALLQAQALGLPVFVYHALSERYPFASDRHHRFVLEGALDVQAELRERGIGYAFHLERPDSRGPWLRQLASRSALTVTEDLPVAPLHGWTGSLAKACGRPVWLVDTACVVPMQGAGADCERAYAFRDATHQKRETELRRRWVEVESDGDRFVPTLPFERVELEEAHLDALIAECEIDHAVGAVGSTRGGSVAGYRRWNEFVDRGLRSYDRTRNNPLYGSADQPGVSRMSAYLHYGQVSPFRLARETVAVDGSGADKYLDELMIWREVAHAFCFHHPDHAGLGGLPKWAVETLAQHESDPREAILSWETLARGRTGDPLWDAAQKSLLTNGELHNNVRMTWGKAFAKWTPDAASALRLAIDLNHRYALDGRDPASYGGLLWCFGGFDRPFRPASPITGVVRDRPTEWHATRVDPQRYLERTSRPAAPNPPRVAVIGAGIAGLACARTLQDHGVPVEVFEKARGPGGRTSTRRGEAVDFDHGAQYFTARDPRFARYVEAWQHDGIVAEWGASVVRLRNGQASLSEGDTRRWVGAPTMSAVAKHLARDVPVTRQFHVEQIDRQGDDFTLRSRDNESHDGFDAIVISAPAPQVAQLAKTVAPNLAQQAAATRFAPCYAVMLGFAERLPVEFDGAFVEASPLSWIARNSSKPGRGASECWVLHASPEWSEAHLEEDSETVLPALVAAFGEAIGIEVPVPTHAVAHRWRFAMPVDPLVTGSLFDESARVGVAGDWCAAPRLEGAFLSGLALAGKLMAWAQRRPSMRQGELFG